MILSKGIIKFFCYVGFVLFGFLFYVVFMVDSKDLKLFYDYGILYWSVLVWNYVIIFSYVRYVL